MAERISEAITMEISKVPKPEVKCDPNSSEFEKLVAEANEICFGRIEMDHHSITIHFPKLSKVQIMFMVNRLMLKDRLELDPAVDLICRLSIAKQMKEQILFIQNDVLSTYFVNKMIQHNATTFLTLLIQCWKHLLINEDDLWQNGTGEPSPYEDHRKIAQAKFEQIRRNAPAGIA